ncbi:hypothetical protein AB0J55_17550 [Amycolatopsis sp. NPDC049688]|uniref:hypothetical protein n=1 Tax=Amycolatopsis sp. NPDC049688 TaxID=3154733 RepID=UPI0034381123
MSKADRILDDELDPEDLDPTPRGGKNGRNTDPDQKTGKFLQKLGERIGFVGIALLTVAAAAVGGLAASCDNPAAPAPTSTCEEDQSCWDCTKDGNKQCGDTAPAVKASCEEPASWCRRSDAAEVVQP